VLGQSGTGPTVAPQKESSTKYICLENELYLQYSDIQSHACRVVNSRLRSQGDSKGLDITSAPIHKLGMERREENHLQG
jgi:hypothetical protein